MSFAFSKQALLSLLQGLAFLADDITDKEVAGSAEIDSSIPLTS
jgi:hypothetical protein